VFGDFGLHGENGLLEIPSNPIAIHQRETTGKSKNHKNAKHPINTGVSSFT
jgi:hypothetical protein